MKVQREREYPMSTLTLQDAGVAFCELCDNVVPTETVQDGPTMFDTHEECAYCGEWL